MKIHRAPKDSEHTDAVASAHVVMETHLSALNAQDPNAIAATMHFPHYRLSSGVMRVWDGPTTYLNDFHARAGRNWQHTRWDSIEVVQASADKVHLDIHFTRFRADNSVLAQHYSLWVIAKIDGVWAAQLRSSFAP